MTGPPGEPGAEFRYVTIATREEVLLEKIGTVGEDAGKVAWNLPLDGSWALPAVTLNGQAGGLSADGGTLVLVLPPYSTDGGQTILRLLDTRQLHDVHTTERIVLDGHFTFDAISPDGRLIYLVQYRSLRNPFDYRVRVYDLAAGGLRPGKVVDPEEPDEQMAGQPIAREMSPDGRWAYTLYGGGEETFIHALDTQGATAVCIDLPDIKPNAAYGVGLAVDPATGAITVSDNKGPTAVVDPESFDVGPPPADQIAEAVAGGISQDGGGWARWAAAGGGLALAAGGLLLFVRRRRRRDDAIDEEALERLVRIDAGSPEGHREREPVP